MKRIVIVGASGFGREVYWWTRTHSSTDWRDPEVVFIDDSQQCLADYPDLQPLYIGTISTWQPSENDVALMAIADPRVKLQLSQKLIDKGARFGTFIHSSCLVVPSSKTGYGSILCPYAGVTCDVTIGRFVTMNCSSGAGHDAIIGDACTLSGFAEVTGKTILGTGVFMGSHACVLPGVRVGDFAKIGAGSVVTRHVKPNTTVMGVPAKRIDLGMADEPSENKGS